MAAGAALSAQRGERPTTALTGASQEMPESMREKQFEDFAGPMRKHLPKTKPPKSAFAQVETRSAVR